MTENIEPTDLLRAEEVPLPGTSITELPSVKELAATLRETVEILQAQIATARDERSRLNAQLADDRAELTRAAEQRRLELNSAIADATQQLAQVTRLLKATEPKKKRAKSA